MKRRIIGLIATLVLTILVVPLAAEVQPAGKVPRLVASVHGGTWLLAVQVRLYVVFAPGSPYNPPHIPHGSRENLAV